MRFLPFVIVLLLWSVASAEPSDKTFEHVWDLVEAKFYDADLNGLDSTTIRAEATEALRDVTDAETTTHTINGFLARLNASHTRLFSHREPGYYELLDAFNFGSYQESVQARFDGRDPHYSGILLMENDGVVVDVVPGGPAEAAGLRRGDRILQADDAPYHPIDSFRGKVGEAVTLQVSRGDSSLDIVVHPELVYPRQAFLRSIEKSARILPGELYNIGYVRIWSYVGEVYHEKLQEVVREKLGAADGLLVDLRGRWGGAQPEYLDLLFSTPKLVFTYQNGKNFETDTDAWNKPTGLMIDETASSGKEVLAFGFRKNELGPLIGSRTQGSLLGGSLHLLPGGYALYLATVDVEVDGQRLEGLGVGPTHAVPPAQLNAERAAEVLALEMFKREVIWRADLDQRERNTAWAKRVVKALGWPTEELVGIQAAQMFERIVERSADRELTNAKLEGAREGREFRR